MSHDVSCCPRVYVCCIQCHKVSYYYYPYISKKSMLRLEILVAKPSQYKPTSERKVIAELKGWYFCEREAGISLEWFPSEGTAGLFTTSRKYSPSNKY